MHAAKQQPRVRAAAVLSKHGPTCRRAALSLGAAGLQVRSAGMLDQLALDNSPELAALLVDLDVAPAESVPTLVDEARSACPGVPLLITAGINARARLLQALCDADVDHVLPKRGALSLAHDQLPQLGSLEGPEEHQLFAAVRRLVDDRRGVERYLLAGAPVTHMKVRSSAEKDVALEQIMAFAESMSLVGEKRRRVELAAEELLRNALYDAPRSPDGTQRHRLLDRRLPVTLEADESVDFGYGCDGQTLAIAVTDSFGALTKREVLDGLRTMRDGLPRQPGDFAPAGLGLVMAYSVANQLIFSVWPGRSTEVTAVLHVGGSNRAAQERGTAVHFYLTRDPAHDASR
jgi:hypothetical protein